MWLFVNNQPCFGYIQITTLNNKNTFGAHTTMEEGKLQIFFLIAICGRSKGWRSGESARLPPKWPGFKSQRRRHMWVEFVVGSRSLLYSERFFSG